MQILGSSAPGPSANRASSGYVILIDGVGRIMVDAAEASLKDIEFIAISHFYPDHSAERPAILWPAGS